MGIFSDLKGMTRIDAELGLPVTYLGGDADVDEDIAPPGSVGNIISCENEHYAKVKFVGTDYEQWIFYKFLSPLPPDEAIPELITVRIILPTGRFHLQKDMERCIPGEVIEENSGELGGEWKIYAVEDSPCEEYQQTVYVLKNRREP